MIDPTAEAEFEHRLPAAYSQGFAHVRVLTVTNPDDVGPLAVPEKRELPAAASALPEGIFPACGKLVAG